MEKRVPRERTRFTLRLEPRDLEALRALAQEEGRTATGQIEYLVRQYVQSRLGGGRFPRLRRNRARPEDGACNARLTRQQDPGILTPE